MINGAFLSVPEHVCKPRKILKCGTEWPFIYIQKIPGKLAEEQGGWKSHGNFGMAKELLKKITSHKAKRKKIWIMGTHQVPTASYTLSHKPSVLSYTRKSRVSKNLACIQSHDNMRGGRVEPQPQFGLNANLYSLQSLRSRRDMSNRFLRVLVLE